MIDNLVEYIDIYYILKIIIFIILSFFFLKIVKGRLIKRIKNLAEKTETDLDNAIIKVLESLGFLFYLFLSLFFAIKIFGIPNKWSPFADKTFLIIFIFYIAKILILFTDYLFDKLKTSQSINKNVNDPTIFKIINSFVNGIIWLIAFLIILQNLGFEISALMGGLGIFGIALAFGVQNILEDVFSVLSIYFDTPFKVGDYINIGNDSGTVKKIGIKSTRLKTLNGQELVVSNKELTKARINNYGMMKERGVSMELNIDMRTSTEDLEKIPKVLSEILSKKEKVELIRIYFKEIGEYSFKYSIFFKILDNDYAFYVKTKEVINLEILKCLEKLNIKIAYPTQNNRIYTINKNI